MTDTIVEQIIAIRDAGLTNMFDINNVMVIANDNEMFELVSYLADKDNRKEYCEFILNGKRKDNNNEKTIF